MGLQVHPASIELWAEEPGVAVTVPDMPGPMPDGGCREFGQMGVNEGGKQG